MNKIKLSDIASSSVKFSMVEDTTEVDGEHVLAKVRGQFFVPNGKSRNGRFYPKSLWEKVIDDPAVQSKINKKLMFGTIGHDGELNDKAIREGQFSHVMTKIEIDGEDKGMGEALVYNTPTGRILNTVLRAGSQLSTSSRANGTFKGKKDGLAIVDEDTYDIDGWDFVIDPGFLEAHPTIAESIESKFKELDAESKTITGDNSMDTKLVEHIANENSELKTKVGDLTDEVTTLQENKKTIEDENTHLKGEIERCEGDKKIIEAFSVLGKVEEIKEALEQATKDAATLVEYSELGDSPAAMKEVLEKAQAFISTVKTDFGSIDKIREALETAIAFKAEVSELGSVEQIKEALTSYLTILDEKKAKETEAKTKALAEELGMEVEKVTALLEKYSVEDIKALHITVGGKVNEESDNLVKKNFDDNGKEIIEDVSESSILGKCRSERINDRFNRI